MHVTEFPEPFALGLPGEAPASEELACLGGQLRSAFATILDRPPESGAWSDFVLRLPALLALPELATADGPAPAAEPARDANEAAHDDYFRVHRVAGQGGRLYLQALLRARRLMLAEAGPADLRADTPWRMIDGALQRLLAEFVGIAPDALSAPPDSGAGWAFDRFDARRRWIRGHQVFAVLTQGLLIVMPAMAGALRRHDRAQWSRWTDLACELLQAVGAAFAFTGDFSSEDYRSLIRPSMMPPQAPLNLSGLMSADHAALVERMRELRPAMRALAELDPDAHARLSRAYGVMYDQHIHVCDRFVGEQPSLLTAGRTERSGPELLADFKKLRLKTFEGRRRQARLAALAAPMPEAVPPTPGVAPEPHPSREDPSMSADHAHPQSLATPSAGAPYGPRAIAIIGLSGRYPGGANTPELLWEVLRSGTDAVTEASGERWDLGWHHPDPKRKMRVYTRAGGYLDAIDTFDADFFGLSAREARQVDPQQRLLLELAWEAYEDAGIAPRGQAGSNTGVFIGLSGNDYGHLIGGEAPDAYSNTGSSFSIAANRISYLFDLHGPSVAVDTACSSSLVCIHQACASLLAGECDSALAGGVNLLINFRPWLGFARASMLSPDGRCKSFDASGNGYVRSEGGGLVLLKPLAAAERDGDRILGVILASGTNSDGRTMGLSMPNGDAQEALLRRVYGECGVTPEEVVYVEAHGTGTAVGDPIECGALGRVLGAPRADGSQCLIGSIKSNIGHLEPASGVAGLTKALLTLRHREIPANLHFSQPNPKINFESERLKVVDQLTPLPRTARPAIIGVNSFGFGGTNAHLVLSEYRPAAPEAAAAPVGTPDLLLISANAEPALRALAQDYITLLERPDGPDWPTLCAAAATTRSPLRHRLALRADHRDRAAERLRRFLDGVPDSFYALGEADGARLPIAFCYSGNGPQWWGMGRELLAADTRFRAEIEAVDRVFAPLSGWSLVAEMQKPESASQMARTEYAQPLLFALQLGLTRLLTDAGITPAACFGHSVGEAAAACASGALTLEDATRVIYHRSAEQGRTAGQGRMAALGVDAAEATALVAALDGWIEIAAVNSPRAVTVAGSAEAIAEAVRRVTAAGKFARELQLDYPFHTRAMAPIEVPLGQALRDLAPQAARVPFISTVDGIELAGATLDAAYWYRNVREPVQFERTTLHLLKERGITLFIEIGPHPVLRDYLLQTAKHLDLGARVLTTLRRPGRKGPEPELDHMAAAICACHACGAGDLATRLKRPNPIPRLPSYPWQRVRHWRGSVQLPDIHHPVKRDHPLLGHRVRSSDGLWETALDTHQLPYLPDHVVQGAVLFPAAGYVEQLLSAGALALGAGTMDIENLEILRPLVLPPHQDPLCQVAVESSDGSFAIRSAAGERGDEWTVHVRGRLSLAPKGAAMAALDLPALRARLTRGVDAAAHYQESRRRGLNYGPRFQGLRAVHLDPARLPGECLAEIHLPTLAGSTDLYRSHPALLDSCIQAMVALIAASDPRPCCTVPVSIRRVRSFGPLTEHLFCHVSMQGQSERSARAGFRICDASGTILMSLEDTRCQKVDFNSAAPSPLSVSWWRPDPVVPAAARPGATPAPAAILAQLAEDLPGLLAADDRQRFHRAVVPRLDALAAAYVAEALDTLALPAEPFSEDTLVASCGVTPAGRGVLAAMLRIALASGLLVGDAGALRRGERRDRTPSAVLWKALMQDHPELQAELQLLFLNGERLAARLRAEQAAEATPLIDQLRDCAPSGRTPNVLTRATVRAAVAAWPADRPLRILELHGGAGGLTAWLLPELPPARCDYLFSDASEALLAQAQHRLAPLHAALRFAVLDPTRPLAEQGLPSGYFDLVLVGDVPVDQAGTTQLLRELGQVASADALLLLVQPRHDPVRALSLGERAGDWEAALRGLGCTEQVVIDDTAACAPGQQPLQSLVLARPGFAHATTVETVPATAHPHTWLLVCQSAAEAGGFAVALAAALAARGDRALVPVMLEPGANPAQDCAERLARSPVDRVLFLAAPGTPGQDSAGCEVARCTSLLGLLHWLEGVRQTSECALTIVTRGAFPSACGLVPADPGQASIWGMGRVISNELPALAVRMVDLHAGPDASADATRLGAELALRDDETEVQLARGVRYVLRQRINTPTDEVRLAARPSARFTLDFLAQGGLDSLHLRELAERAPAEDEVEIAVKASGLNFRDVLWTMGMLPEEALENGFSGPTIGMECAGEVVRVGSGVRDLQPGDRVVAFASSCFASHVVTRARSAARIPDRLDYAAAATLPTAFLTAYYALDHLARLEAGETVLIHGAAGGVGLAALQIAQLKGARVIGTAGSPRKRRMLALLGVDHVLDSRSLAFADEVLALTGGEGVDVVFNSLAGEAITKGLQCLRPFGRFLEIGKRDLHANSRIGLRPFRNNLSYFGIDADTLLTEKPALAARMFSEVMALIHAGRLQPLPFQQVPVARAAEAFRAMQQARHVGKLVVTLAHDPPERLAVLRGGPMIRADATYLVTGGLGGFGLATALWLAEQGARSLALLGRRGAVTDEARAGVARLEAMGARVRSFAVDVADAAALQAALTELRGCMPALAGVVHSAAVIEDAPLLTLSPEQLVRVFEPKVRGAWNLHTATLQDKLDLFVLYSSSSAVVGNPGQGAYVAANLCLDALARFRRAIGLPALAVGWGAIKDAGFLTRHENVAGMLKQRTGLDATPAGEALADLGRVLRLGSTCVSVARFDLQRLGQMLPGARVPRFLTLIPQGEEVSLQGEVQLADQFDRAPVEERKALVVAHVHALGARVLGTSTAQVRVDQPLAELGLDSLMAVELAGALERSLGQPMSVMQVISAGSLSAIADVAIGILAARAQGGQPASAGEATRVAS